MLMRLPDRLAEIAALVWEAGFFVGQRDQPEGCYLAAIAPVPSGGFVSVDLALMALSQDPIGLLKRQVEAAS